MTQEERDDLFKRLMAMPDLKKSWILHSLFGFLEYNDEAMDFIERRVSGYETI